MSSVTAASTGFLSSKSVALSLLTGAGQVKQPAARAEDAVERLVATAKKAQSLKLPSAKMAAGTMNALLQSTQQKVDAARRAALNAMPEVSDPMVRRLYELSDSERSYDLTATERSLLGDTGAEYARLSTPQMEREEMQAHVLHYLRNYTESGPQEMWDALEAGTATFQRVVDVPEMDGPASSYEIYHDGDYYGVKGLYASAPTAMPKGNPSGDYVDKLKDSGVGVQHGSIAGQYYLITWPKAGDTAET